MILETDDVELSVGIEWCDERCRDRNDHEEGQHTNAPRSGRMPKKSPPSLVAEGAMSQRPNCFGCEDDRNQQGKPRAERHAGTSDVSGPPSAGTRTRGSAIPIRMSASRFPDTTSVLAIRAVAVTNA